jgi:hypothetical protein
MRVCSSLPPCKAQDLVNANQDFRTATDNGYPLANNVVRIWGSVARAERAEESARRAKRRTCPEDVVVQFISQAECMERQSAIVATSEHQRDMGTSILVRMCDTEEPANAPKTPPSTSAGASTQYKICEWLPFGIRAPTVRSASSCQGQGRRRGRYDNPVRIRQRRGGTHDALAPDPYRP